MKNSKENQALSDALEPIITKLIDRNFEDSQDKIALQISPLIAPAIREQMKANKSSIIEALYPILGSMISKFVTKSLEDALNSINNQIQNGLSFSTLKRKLKAKRKGITETQLLLEENSYSNIRTVLLIHKETGIILAQAHNTNESINEPEMVASMMTAITSFINDWIEKNESGNEVAEIDYGSSKIILENAGYAYLAVIIDGAAYNKTLQKIRNTLENIILVDGETIRAFNGDLNIFSDSNIEESMSHLIDNNQQEESKKKTKIHPITFMIPLAFIAFLTWYTYKSYLHTTLEESVQSTLYKSPHLTTFRIDTYLENDILYINGAVPFSYHKHLAQDLVLKVKGVKAIENNLLILPTIDDPMQISAKISYLLKGLNTDDGINVTYEYNYPTLLISGSTWDTHRKNKIISTLKSIKFIDKINIAPPKIKSILYFDKGIFLLNKNQKAELLLLAKKLYLLDNNIVLSIEGYSDNKGSIDQQKYVAKARANTIANHLKNKLFVTQTINISSEDDISIHLDVNGDANKQRCSIITIQNQEK